MTMFLILTIISLLYIIFEYYDITRYFTMYFYDCSHFVNTYKLLNKASPDNRVVIALYESYPKRNIKPVINSLFDQSVSSNEICMFVNDFKCKEQLKEYIVLFETSNCPILPVLQKEQESDTIIIILNTNTIYSPDLIEDLIENVNHHPNKILFLNPENNVTHGCVFRPKYLTSDIVSQLALVSDDERINDIFRKNMVVDSVYVSVSNNYPNLF